MSGKQARTERPWQERKPGPLQLEKLRLETPPREGRETEPRVERSQVVRVNGESESRTERLFYRGN